MHYKKPMELLKFLGIDDKETRFNLVTCSCIYNNYNEIFFQMKTQKFNSLKLIRVSSKIRTRNSFKSYPYHIDKHLSSIVLCGIYLVYFSIKYNLINFLFISDCYYTCFLNLMMLQN